MSSAGGLGFLRERNKDLLDQLKQQREKLQRRSACSQSRKREREDGAEERRDPAETPTLTGGDRHPARAALTKPSVRFADACEEQTGTQQPMPSPRLSSRHRGGSAEHKTPSDLFRGSERLCGEHSGMQDARRASTKSCLENHSKEHKGVRSRATSQSDECHDVSATERHHLQPLLGYDWIAGVLDADDSLMERSDEFFNDLHMFRSLYRDECVKTSPQAQFSEEKHSNVPLRTDEDSAEANMDTHQCTFSYRVNSRLFPVPLHSEECCPVCKKHKSSHPHTVGEPALIRVSIPRSALLPPHKYKAHRRCSFDPTDSLGLPSHCLSGWSNKGQTALPPPSSLDLRSSLNIRKSSRSQNEEVEGLPASKVPGNQISDVSRLARHNLQHFSPRRKLGSASYPLR